MIKKADLKRDLFRQDLALVELKKNLGDLEKKYALLLDKRSPSTEEFASRIADLEIKMAKLWGAILQYDERKDKIKLSNTGRKFLGGMSKSIVER